MSRDDQERMSHASDSILAPNIFQNVPKSQASFKVSAEEVQSRRGCFHLEKRTKVNVLHLSASWPVSNDNFRGFGCTLTSNQSIRTCKAQGYVFVHVRSEGECMSSTT